MKELEEQTIKEAKNHNPLGILGIDHLEFCTQKLDGKIAELFYQFGFQITHENKKLNSVVFSQGQVRFVLIANPSTGSHSQRYLKKHGEGVSKISFLVEDVEAAMIEAKARGAKIVKDVKSYKSANGMFKTGCIQGFGDVWNEFVERPANYFRASYKKLKEDPKARPLASRCARIDHLTNNVPRGELEKWVKFYHDIFGFEVTRYFDIKGKKTGLNSKVVQLPNGVVIIPINEPESNKSKSQIQEFLDVHKGPGVQHIALTCSNIIATVEDLQKRGIKFLKIPSTYYQDISKRGFKVDEDPKVLEARQLLVDGDKEGYLIQNFTDTYIGPLFFEFIQRKKHQGFGEGNFQALFDAIERDQMARGYLK